MLEVPLPWERLLWSSRSRLFGTRYALTDFRLVSTTNRSSVEITLYDIDEVRRTRSLFERLTGRSTLLVQGRDRRSAPIVLRGIRQGEQLAALLELLGADPQQQLDCQVVRAALHSSPWRTRTLQVHWRHVVITASVFVLAVFGVGIGLKGHEAPVVYPADDAIRPGGEKRSREEIVRFMETEVLPWAERALTPLVGAGRVNCETCHGSSPEDRMWSMPGVAALPNTDVVGENWERYTSSLDAQMRNAIYGYAAESDNQARAAYMREVVMPGMARLLHRPAYDFTKTYDYNRTHAAFGCYHCHRVK